MKNEPKVNFIHICDFASFGEGGKLNIMGIFENISPNVVPYMHPQLFVVANISILKSGKFTQIIKIVSDDEKTEIAKLEFPSDVKIPADKKTAKIGILTQFNSVNFEKYGKYKIQILIDDELIKEEEINILNSKK